METILPAQNSVKNEAIIPTPGEEKTFNNKHYILQTILWTILGILFLCLLLSLIYQNGKNIYMEGLQ